MEICTSGVRETAELVDSETLRSSGTGLTTDSETLSPGTLEAGTFETPGTVDGSFVETEEAGGALSSGGDSTRDSADSTRG